MLGTILSATTHATSAQRADFIVYGATSGGFWAAIAVARGVKLPCDFHWADKIQGFGEVSELGVNGDSAPNRRWNYRYSVAE